jgi:cyclic pyranopterin phosphate synthase
MVNRYKKKQDLESEDILEKFKELGLPENFCPVPFTTLIAEPDGRIGSCRLKGAEFEIGNILDEKDIFKNWNSDFIKKWREEFLTGNVKICEREIRHRGCNLCSENNKLLDKIDFNVEQNKILKFTANFNGFCNLECQMCHIWQKPNGLYDKIDFWNVAEKDIFPYILEMDFLSGEPFLQKDTFKLIDAVSPINPDCKWLFTTNANYKFSTRLSKYLDKIELKSLMISIDSLIPEVFSKIRLKGDLDLVLETSRQFNDYRNSRERRGLKDFPIYLGFLVQKDNWKELGNVIDYCDEMNFRVHIQYAYEPMEYSLMDLDEKEHIKILDWYLENLSWDQIEMGIRAITPSFDKLSPIVRADYLLRLKEKRENGQR